MKKGYIDPSTVDLMDVYPERYQTVPEQIETPTVEPVLIPLCNSFNRGDGIK